MAGEIVETWPRRSVTIVGSGPGILGSTAKSASVHAAKILGAARGGVADGGTDRESVAGGRRVGGPGRGSHRQWQDRRLRF
jgi:hypothetical protein